MSGKLSPEVRRLAENLMPAARKAVLLIRRNSMQTQTGKRKA
jgi:hypothetical protein